MCIRDRYDRFYVGRQGRSISAGCLYCTQDDAEDSRGNHDSRRGTAERCRRNREACRAARQGDPDRRGVPGKETTASWLIGCTLERSCIGKREKVATAQGAHDMMTT